MVAPGVRGLEAEHLTGAVDGQQGAELADVACQNGKPRVVSLDAQTTRSSLRAAAAWKTLKFMVMLLLNVTAGVLRPGGGGVAASAEAWP